MIKRESVRPKSIKEAVDELMLTYKDQPLLDQLKKMKEDELIQCHFGLGMSIRNNFGMWEPDSELCKDISNKYCNGEPVHPDDASYFLIQEFWMEARKSAPTVLKKGKWLTFYNKDGYEYFHRHNKPNAVAIVAITDNNELVLVEQKRVPQDKMVVEIPAGLVDEGESFEVAAKRELLEETGYGEGNIVEIIENVPATPGICSERLTFVIMTGVKKIGAGGGLASENEFINVSTHPLPYLINIQNSDKYYDLKLFAGLYFASKWSKRLP
jgi:ADP-ribose pyrophosphatase